MRNDESDGGERRGPMRRMAGLLLDRPAYAILSGDADLPASQKAARFHSAWRGLMLLSAMWGVASAAIWAGAWRVFGDFDWVRLLPAVITASAVLLVYRRAAAALVDILGGADATVRSVLASVIVVGMAVCFRAVKQDQYNEPYQLPALIAWVRPDDKLCRVLVLMPLWGAWSMLVGGQFCRPGKAASPAMSSLFRGCGAMTSVLCLALTWVMTAFYFQYLPPAQFLISSGATAAVAVVGGIVLCRLNGGLDLKALRATNMLTQIAFLLAFLAHG